MKTLVKLPEAYTRLSIYFLITLLCLSAFTLHAQNTRYVKTVASGTGDGSSWANASANLQSMINSSAVNDMVFVAEGMYLASPASFVMKEGVKIYGGFNGSETQLSQRDWTTHPTILRGNNNTVIVNSNLFLTNASILDGFIVSGGNSIIGAGMHNDDSSPIISNCTFTDNIGPAIHNSRSSPWIRNCSFTNNTNASGAGISNLTNSYPTISNCTFSSNISTAGPFSNGGGGAIYNSNSSPIFIDCRFSGNSTSNLGGAVLNTGSGASFTNCIFENNSGAAGGAMNNTNSPVSIINCVFQGNYGVEIPFSSDSEGGAVYNGSCSPLITGCQFISNHAKFSGAITNDGSAPVISNCIFSGNWAQNNAVMSNRGSATKISNCIFSGNNAQVAGSAISNLNSGSPVITNCTFSGNNSAVGGPVHNETGSGATLYNCIIWGNVRGITNTSGAGTVTVEYCIVQGGYPGAGNRNEDPVFIFAPTYTTAPFTNGIYKLSHCGPGINTGNNALLPVSLTTDLEGKPRISSSTVDLGAYEDADLVPGSGNIIYVNSTLLSGNGSADSWNNATSDLAYALMFAKRNENLWTPANPLKIFVAKGLQRPMFPADNNCQTVNLNDRNNTFSLVSNVHIYGGFDPNNGIDDLSDTRPVDFPFGTIMSGDLGVFTVNTDNVYHVVTAVNTTNVLLDAVTVMSGNANSAGTVNANGVTLVNNNGGGIYNHSSAITLTNCLITGNSAGEWGGGIYNTPTSALIINNSTSFASNNAAYGGGIFNNGTSPSITDCRFTGNISTYGGGLYNHNSSSPTVTNSYFSTNQATIYGGAVYNNAGSTAHYDGCNFSSNSTTNTTGGGGALFNNSSSPVLANCVFSGNSGDYGGAVYNFSTAATYINGCTFNNNTSITFGGAVYNDPGSSPVILNSGFSDNNSAFGGAMLNGGNANVVKCFFTGNSAASYGGAVYNLAGPSNYTNCIFSGNTAIHPAGGGGGMFNNSGMPTITNCTFNNNTGGFGGAIHNYAMASPAIRNNIIWGNSSAIHNESTASASVQNSIIQGGYAGAGNLNADPLFINTASPIGPDFSWGTLDDGLRLQPCSPATNAGSNGSVPGTITSDFGGIPRIQFTTVDMGAYEANSLANASAANIVSSNITVTAWQDPAAKTFYSSNCTTLIAAVTGNGTPSPISGNTTVKAWIEPSQPSQIVRRHYEITPDVNPATSTGIITLYFTQAEFDAFNAVNIVKLPQNSSDASGKANLLIEKRSGTSNNNTGLPNSYTGTITTINPNDADIIWNATASRWEISFAVAGFSGFFVKTTSAILPLRLINFTAKENNCIAFIEWITTEESNVSHFEIQQSTEGNPFITLQRIAATNTGNQTSYSISTPVINAKTAYRLKMVDIDGRTTYSQVILVTAACTNRILLYPVPAKDRIVIRNASIGSTYTLFDNTGKAITNGHITNPEQKLQIEGLAPGIYYISLADPGGNSKKLRFVKE